MRRLLKDICEAGRAKPMIPIGLVVWAVFIGFVVFEIESIPEPICWHGMILGSAEACR